jgi:hypothetical protein
MPKYERETMTRSRAVQELQEIRQGEKDGPALVAADQVLCDLLNDLGYDEVVTEYKKIPRE